MLKPSEDILRALVSLEGKPDWKEICEWLRDSLIQQSIQNNKSQGDATRIIQGRNQELEEILNYADKAREHLVRARESKRQEQTIKGGI